MLAGRDALDALADLATTPAPSWPKTAGGPSQSSQKTDIRVADARGHDPHQDFVRARPFQFEGFDL